GTRPLVAVDADAPAVPAPPEKPTAAVQEAAINRAPDDVMTSAETADLLEALRRRRGQREASPSAPEVIADAATAAERESSPISLFEDFAAGDLPSTDATPEPPTPAPETSSKRRRRNAM